MFQLNSDGISVEILPAKKRNNDNGKFFDDLLKYFVKVSMKYTNES